MLMCIVTYSMVCRPSRSEVYIHSLSLPPSSPSTHPHTHPQFHSPWRSSVFHELTGMCGAGRHERNDCTS